MIIRQDTFVNDNTNIVIEEAKSTLNTLTKWDMKILKYEKAHSKWMSLEKES